MRARAAAWLDLGQRARPERGVKLSSRERSPVMWWNDYMWADYWPFPWIMPLIMIVFMIVCMTMMVSMMRHRTRHSADRNAVAILKERYARGEINQAEFDERRRFLEA
jgi:putative membrane protein